MATNLTLTAPAADSVAPIPLGDTAAADGQFRLPLGAAPPERVLVLVSNLDAATAADVTLLAGSDPPAHSAARGALAFTLDATGGTYPDLVLLPSSSARWLQADNSLLFQVALNGGTGGVRFTAYALPRL